MNNDELKDLPLWGDPETNALFEQLCEESGFPSSQIRALLALQRRFNHMDRARGIYEEMDNCLSQGEF